MSERDWKQTPTLDELTLWRRRRQHLVADRVQAHQNRTRRLLSGTRLPRRRFSGCGESWMPTRQSLSTHAIQASYVAGYADATFRVRQVLDGQR